MKTETKLEPRKKAKPNGSGTGTEMRELRLKVPAELVSYLDQHYTDKRAWIAGAIVQRIERDRDSS